jgi:hypothetical protein
MDKWTNGNMEKWTRDWRHERMETWTHGDMDTRRHGHGDTDMETRKYNIGKFLRLRKKKRVTEAHVIFLNPFTVCSSCKKRMRICNTAKNTC